MHAQYRPIPAPRFNSFHGPKHQLIGNPANHIAPAWRPLNGQMSAGPQMRVPSGPLGRTRQQEFGSKILISNLPPDVGEKEVEELFQKTVGPLKDVLIIYNSQGRSKGMGVVTFQRTGDAAIARSKYHHKIVDGKRPIKIETVVDEVTSMPASVPQAARTPSLLQRIGGVKPSAPVSVAPTRPRQHIANGNNSAQAVMPIPRRRQKKGPKRINKKLGAKSAADLDREMEAYRAAADS